ncbi:MAG: alpha/beta hydrolase [Saprospiraceae bacterium]|nr:alpha/beta hydrolase [Saprospiraceae bacterium]
MKLQRLDLSANLSLAYEDTGQGPKTIVFIHGLGSDRHCWQKNCTTLQQYYRCIALDLPGYGDSSKADYPYSMSFYAQCIAALIERLELGTVVLAGHSMGAQIAIHLTLKRPQLVERLVLIAPAGFELFSPQEKSWFAQLYRPDLLQMVPVDQFVRNMEQNFYDLGPDTQPMRDERLRLYRSEDYSRYTKMISANIMSMLQEPVFDQLSQLHLPVLILFGERDRMIPNPLLHPQWTTLQIAEAGQQQISQSQLFMVPLAGHFVQWEQAFTVNEYLKAFLKN